MNPLWNSNPVVAFKQWIESPAYQDTAVRLQAKETLSASSKKVYTSMFGKYVRFLLSQSLSVPGADAQAIYGFLTQSQLNGTPVLNSNIQQRYLRLLERVYTHIGTMPRPTDDLMFGEMRDNYRLKGKNMVSVSLTVQEQNRFRQALPSLGTEDASQHWKKSRDRLMLIFMLGAGLTVAELLSMRTDQVQPTPELDGGWPLDVEVPGDESGVQDHTTILAAEFHDDLASWLRIRDQLPFMSDLLFPGTDGRMLDKASVYRLCKRTFSAGDILVPHEGGRTLRNTYAVNQLFSGTPPLVLKERLGLFEDRSMLIYLELQKRDPR